MLSRVIKRSYHISGKFTHQESVTNFIMKSIEDTNYDSAKHCLKEHSECLSLSNINTINKTLENNKTMIFMKLYGYIMFGQAMCYVTNNYAVFPMLIGSFDLVTDCINHRKLEEIVKSIEFKKIN